MVAVLTPPRALWPELERWAWQDSSRREAMRTRQRGALAYRALHHAARQKRLRHGRGTVRGHVRWERRVLSEWQSAVVLGCLALSLATALTVMFGTQRGW